MSGEKQGKVFVAANPWRLKNISEAMGVPIEVIESDFVPDGKVLILDLDELFRPLDEFYGFDRRPA